MGRKAENQNNFLSILLEEEKEEDDQDDSLDKSKRTNSDAL